MGSFIDQIYLINIKVRASVAVCIFSEVLWLKGSVSNALKNLRFLFVTLQVGDSKPTSFEKIIVPWLVWRGRNKNIAFML